MNEVSQSMHEYYSNLEVTAALVLLVLSSTYYIFYILITVLIKNRSSRYRFVQSKETAVMWHAGIGFCIAIALLILSVLLTEKDYEHIFILCLKSGMAIGVAIGVGFAIRTYLIVYYPFILEKRLADIRFKERKSSKSGRPLRLLNEEEEDKYLTEEMIKQEDEFRFDFDVWLDEGSGETIIETYLGSTNRVCQKCNFRTLKLTKEEIDDDSNIKILHYECSHCGNKLKEQDL